MKTGEKKTLFRKGRAKVLPGYGKTKPDLYASGKNKTATMARDTPAIIIVPAVKSAGTAASTRLLLWCFNAQNQPRRCGRRA